MTSERGLLEIFTETLVYLCLIIVLFQPAGRQGLGRLLRHVLHHLLRVRSTRISTFRSPGSNIFHELNVKRLGETLTQLNML